MAATRIHTLRTSIINEGEDRSPLQVLARSMSNHGPCTEYQEEAITDFDLSKAYSRDSMLARIRDIIPAESKLLSRSFVAPRGGQVLENGVGNHSNAKQQVTIMQFNILAQALSLGADNFVLCPVPALEWCTRRFRLLEEILLVNPDVLCLQEVDHFHFFKVMLAKLGYVGQFFPKPDSPCIYTSESNGPDGCAMFYKSDVLELVENKNRVLQVNQQDSNQVSIMCKFRFKDSNKEFCVATTHLKAKSGYDERRFLQGTDLLQEVTSFSQGSPLFVCGDFNADSSESVIKAYRKDTSTLKSAYMELSPNGDEETPYTTWKVRGGKRPGDANAEACRTIDYIWYRKGGCHIDSLLSIPTEEEIGANRLPSWTYPSDHFSLAVNVSFVPKQ